MKAAEVPAQKALSSSSQNATPSARQIDAQKRMPKSSGGPATRAVSRNLRSQPERLCVLLSSWRPVTEGRVATATGGPAPGERGAPRCEPETWRALSLMVGDGAPDAASELGDRRVERNCSAALRDEAR